MEELQSNQSQDRNRVRTDGLSRYPQSPDFYQINSKQDSFMCC
ncbi:hypothetical protein CHELA40_10523 [Chelatococcus asaccharovorans]|nr:hypothetical protein CHELA40_10523 [Chelatococcus asaccharovorans]CAH1686595.1 hypothetical protein CHELA17_65085 [Chelatococcus asaccharovorans]